MVKSICPQFCKAGRHFAWLQIRPSKLAPAKMYCHRLQRNISNSNIFPHPDLDPQSKSRSHSSRFNEYCTEPCRSGPDPQHRLLLCYAQALEPISPYCIYGCDTILVYHFVNYNCSAMPKRRPSWSKIYRLWPPQKVTCSTWLRNTVVSIKYWYRYRYIFEIGAA